MASACFDGAELGVEDELFDEDLVGDEEELAEDEEVLLDEEEDKPGFSKWVEALTSRRFSSLANSCVGQWLPDERLVVLVQRRGKRFATMGFTRDG